MNGVDGKFVAETSLSFFCHVRRIRAFTYLLGSVGGVVERRSLAGELSLSCARPAADGSPLMWVSHPL